MWERARWGRMCQKTTVGNVNCISTAIRCLGRVLSRGAYRIEESKIGFQKLIQDPGERVTLSRGVEST